MRQQQFRGGMNELVRQTQRLKRKVDETREAVRGNTLVATVANDKVKVTVNYGREVIKIEVDPEFLAADREMALDSIAAATNSALKAAAEAMDKEIEKATGGVVKGSDFFM
jgi:DNA-binding protein YbaB